MHAHTQNQSTPRQGTKGVASEEIFRHVPQHPASVLSIVNMVSSLGFYSVPHCTIGFCSVWFSRAQTGLKFKLLSQPLSYLITVFLINITNDTVMCLLKMVSSTAFLHSLLPLAFDGTFIAMVLMTHGLEVASSSHAQMCTAVSFRSALTSCNSALRSFSPRRSWESMLNLFLNASRFCSC